MRLTHKAPPELPLAGVSYCFTPDRFESGDINARILFQVGPLATGNAAGSALIGGTPGYVPDGLWTTVRFSPADVSPLCSLSDSPLAEQSSPPLVSRPPVESMEVAFNLAWREPAHSATAPLPLRQQQQPLQATRSHFLRFESTCLLLSLSLATSYLFCSLFVCRGTVSFGLPILSRFSMGCRGNIVMGTKHLNQETAQQCVHTLTPLGRPTSAPERHLVS